METIAGLRRRLDRGEVSPRELVGDALARIDERDGEINAFITVRGEEALAEADALAGSRYRGPLWGVPIAVKDIIDVAGTRTTAASAILRENVANADAHVVERLRAAGAVIVGKVNTHEFAYGALTTSPHFGPARNPWDTTRVCGGSSGGSGAAVAARIVPGALGTDTAGSVRVPAAFCGVTGLRPTTGLVSNRGVIPVAWTFDTVGPLAHTAEDCALLLQATAGHDPLDGSTIPVSVPPYGHQLTGGVRGLRIGVLRSLFSGTIDPRIAATVEDALRTLEQLGATLVNVDLGPLTKAGAIQQAIQFVEAAEYHRDWLEQRPGDYGADVRARLLVGLFLPPTTYVTGQRARRRLMAELGALFDQTDVLAAPTMPVLPPRIGEETVDVNGETTPYRLTVIPYNSPWSCTGTPALSLPCGFVDGLPVGLAVAGRRFAEPLLLRLGHAFQQETDWHARLPLTPAA